MLSNILPSMTLFQFKNPNRDGLHLILLQKMSHNAQITSVRHYLCPNIYLWLTKNIYIFHKFSDTIFDNESYFFSLILIISREAFRVDIDIDLFGVDKSIFIGLSTNDCKPRKYLSTSVSFIPLTKGS